MKDYESLTKQEASKLIANKILAVESLISECESIADYHKTPFRLDVGGYGMGGRYDEDWDSSGDERDFTWNASSESC